MLESGERDGGHNGQGERDGGDNGQGKPSDDTGVGEGPCLEVDSRDHPVSDNVIPLSPQWLYPKPGEPRTPTQIQEGSLRPGGLGAIPPVGWREGQRDLPRDGERKRDWWREREPRGDREREGDAPPRSTPHRWRDEEREVVGRRDKWEGPDRRDPRWQDNSSRDSSAGGESRRGWGLEVGSRERDSSRDYEGKKDGKWGRQDRWGGGEEKDKEFKRDKWQEADREADNPRDVFGREKVKEDGPDATRVGRDFEKWSSRHGGRGLDSSSISGRSDSRSLGHGSARPFLAGRGRGLGSTTGQLHRASPANNIGTAGQDRVETMSTKLPSAAADAFRYPRGKLLDIYKSISAAGVQKLPDGFVEVEKHTQAEMLEPLAFLSLDGEEEALIQAIRKGEYVPEPVRVKGSPTPGVVSGRGRDESSHIADQQFRIRGRGQELAKEDLGFDGHREEDFFDAPGFGDVQGGDVSAFEKLLEQRFADSSVADQSESVEVDRDGSRDRRKGDDMREDVNWRRRSSFEESNRSDGVWRSRLKSGEDGFQRDDRGRMLESEREKDERAWKAYEKPARLGGSRDENRSWKAYDKAHDDDAQQATRDEKAWRREEAGGSRFAPEDRTWRKEVSSKEMTITSDTGHGHAGESKSIPPEELELFYRDPQGETQGPFSGRDIIAWFKGGFFGLDLPVRRADVDSDTPFMPLSSVMPHLKPKPLPLPPGFDAARAQEEVDAEQASTGVHVHEAAELSADFARQTSIGHAGNKHTVLDGQRSDNSVAPFVSGPEQLTSSGVSFRKEAEGKLAVPAIAAHDKQDVELEELLKEDIVLPQVKPETRPRRRMSAFSALAEADEGGLGHLWAKQPAESKGVTECSNLAGSKQQELSVTDEAPSMLLPPNEDSLSHKHLLPHLRENQLHGLPSKQSLPLHGAEHPSKFGTLPEFDIADGVWSGRGSHESQGQGHNRVTLVPQESQAAARSFDQMQSQRQDPALQEQLMQHLQQENHQFPHPSPQSLPVMQGQMMGMSFPDMVRPGVPGGLPTVNHHTGLGHVLNHLQPGVPPQLSHHMGHFPPHMIPRHLPPHVPTAAHMDYVLQHQHQLLKERSREAMMSPGELYALQQQEQILQHLQQGRKEQLGGTQHAGAWKVPDAVHQPQQPQQQSEQFQGVHGRPMHPDYSIVSSFDHQRERFHAMQAEGASAHGHNLHLREHSQGHFERVANKLPLDPASHQPAPVWPQSMTTGSHSAPQNLSGPPVSLDRARPATSQSGTDEQSGAVDPLLASQQEGDVSKVSISLQDLFQEKHALPVPKNAAGIENGENKRFAKTEDAVNAWPQRSSVLQEAHHWRKDVEGFVEPHHLTSPTPSLPVHISAVQASAAEVGKASHGPAQSASEQGKLFWSAGPLQHEEDSVSGNGTAWGPAPIPKPKSITEIQQEEAAQQQASKDKVAGDTSLRTGQQMGTAGVSQIRMSTWGVAAAPTPAKSLRQIQEEEALVAHSHIATAAGVAAARGAPAPGPPWAISVVPSQEQKPPSQDASNLQVGPAVDSASQSRPLETTRASSLPGNDPIAMDQSDFVEPKESKKAKKAKKGKAANSGKGSSPSPSPVVIEQPAVLVPQVSLGTQRRQSQQQEESELPAAPGPSLGDFLKLYPGNEESTASQPAAWHVESVKARNLREIQEIERKAAEARAREMSQLAQQQVQMMTATVPPGTRSGAGSSAWVRPSPSASSTTSSLPSNTPVVQQKASPAADVAMASTRPAASLLNEEEDELLWNYDGTVMHLGAVNNPQRTSLPDRQQPEYPSLPADKAGTVRGNGKGNGASMAKPAAAAFRQPAAPVPTAASRDFPSLTAALPSPSVKAGKVKKAAQEHQSPAVQSRKNNQDATAREQARAFRQWCESHIKHITGNDDMTLLEFCVSLPSSTEAGEYISQYLGPSQAVNNFKMEFLERKQQLATNILRLAFPPSEAAIQDEPGRQNNLGEGSMFAPVDRRTGSAVMEQSAHGAEADAAEGHLGTASSHAVLKKRAKKGKKVVDPRLLGFSVTSNRIMMGEIQHPDDV